MSEQRPENFIIIGVTRDGKRFRPSDWAERLCGIMSAFGADNRMTYSPYVRPGSHSGEKCVYVAARLHDVEPLAYKFLVSFANDNDLKVIRTGRPDDTMDD
ncbi:MAG: DUF3579 domain-containing protein [Rhodocyclales bacterium]|nr:DUF3579 domain-containing protein [Rhodocyclales bacterium]